MLLLVELRLVLVAWDDLVAGTFKHWATLGVILAGAAASAALVAGVARSARRDRWLVASTVLDAVLAFLVVLPSVLWPRPAYVGTLAGPDFGIWPIIAAASGLRLSRLAALAGSGSAAAAVLALVALDHARNGARLVYGAPEIALALVVLAGATLLGLALEGRIRRLVAQGAEEARAAERARNRLGAYVSDAIAEVVLREPDALPGGVERQVAVLFSDLRGFTRSGQSLRPDALIAELNAYFEAMVGAIHAEGGVVDKYMGDAILVVFGIPERRGDEAGRAIRTALRMEAALAEHNAERARAGRAALRHGIGVHFGPVVAGNVGTRARLQYTVIGDTVNVASRLQTASKELGSAVVLSDAVVERAREEAGELPPLRPLGSLELRGRAGALSVHTPAI